MVVFVGVIASGVAVDDEHLKSPAPKHPLAVAERQALTNKLEAQLKALPDSGSDAGRTVRVHSQRGDALFFSGRYAEAVDEYQAMVKIDPAQDSSHWRLGIALFFADQPKKAVAQFEKYHSFDDVDRENGIWRYLSQYRASTAETAKKELLSYDKDDREPFPAVYKLFDESLSPEGALSSISKDLPEAERDKRLFYTELYIGIHKVVQKKPEEARKYLTLAVSRKWPRNAGFGPNYMWHVGRVQLEELLKKKAP